MKRQMNKRRFLKMMGLGTVCCLMTQWAVGVEEPSAKFKPEAGSLAESKKNDRWAFVPDPKLPNVLIIGDSISVGYTLEVRKLMAGKANVFRPLAKDGKSAENCSGTTAGVEKLDRWLGDTKWAVIHFNWGLHDMKHVTKAGNPSGLASDPVQATVEQYTGNLEVLVKKLKATGAKLIFATTTPVVDGCLNPLREPGAPCCYNEAAVKVMNANGIKVNDLYAFTLPQLQKIQLPKNVHFTAEGSKLIAEKVAAAIEVELNRK